MNKHEQRQRLRAAKRRNRERCLRQWKDNTKTVPPCLQVLRRQMARTRRALDTLTKALYPTIKQIKDCIGGILGGGLIKGYLWSETPTSAPAEGAEE